MKNIEKIRFILAKNTYAVVAAQVLFAICISAINIGSASAAGQLTARSMQMSDSGPSNNASITSGVGSGTNAAYKFLFTPVNTASIGAIVIDFCSNTALAFDTCNAPTNFNTNYSTTSIYNPANLGTPTFSVYTGGSYQINNRIVLTRTAGGTLAAGATFELGNGTSNGFTNPSTTGSFYARIFTYPFSALTAAQNHAPATSDTSYADFGAVALSTATVITITARVQESLLFCMSAASPTSNCTGTTAPSLQLGTGTGAAKIIDSNAVYSGTVYSQLSTNAGAGATIRIHNANSSCGGLSVDGGTSCGIPPARSGVATTPTAINSGAMAPGTAAFGLAVTAGSGMTASAPYDGVAASNYYGMDSTTSSSNVTTTYGSSVLTASAPLNNVTSSWTFAATASNVTPAGLYTANIAAIATGQF